MPIEAEIASLQQEIEGYEQTLKGFTPSLNQLVKAISHLPSDVPIDPITEQMANIGKEQKIVKAEIADRKLKVEALQKGSVSLSVSETSSLKPVDLRRRCKFNKFIS